MEAEHNNSVLCCWAKLAETDGSLDYHPLLCHMIDVAQVALEMWRSVLSTGQRMKMTASLGFGEDDCAAGVWCAFLAGLHDLGKASPSFQLQVKRVRADVVKQLHGVGLSTGTRHHGRRTPHGTITAATLPGILSADFGVGRQAAQRLGVVVGGHHGVLPPSSAVQKVGASARGDGSWDEHRRALVDTLAGLLNVSRAHVPVLLDNSSSMTLAGFVSVADWVGSRADHFPYVVPSNLDTYARCAASRAERALRDLGWLMKPPPLHPRSFAALFPSILEPNDLQRSVESLATQLTGQSMVIVEAPMGEGKTEAAIYMADRWASSGQLTGHYFALPTQATSNQMFTRILGFLGGRYRDKSVQLQLLHGHASLSSEFQVLRRAHDRRQYPQYGGVDGSDLAVSAAEWFTHRKRGLLAPFGVGTIDQCLLAALQTKHVFVRLFGLSHKTVIIDEVHAYDAYMTTLLGRLAEWIAALGSSLVLLSATLPRTQREELMAAYSRGLGRGDSTPPPATDYPRVSWVLGGADQGSRTVGVAPRSTKRVAVKWVHASTPAEGGVSVHLGEMLQQALGQGGCAAVICNTVRRAQDVFRLLKPYFRATSDDGGPELDILHSQFTFGQRERREARSLARFGRPDAGVVRRPRRAVLVSTQVIEQSLDLDFDLMVTEMAPADLLLQRIGRLHRHERDRPRGLETPQVFVSSPEIVDGVPRFDPGTEAVYDEHVLLRSWMVLESRGNISVPEDVETIIESVYSDSQRPDDLAGPLRERWEHTRGQLELDRDRYRYEAAKRWIKAPSYRGHLWRLTEDTRDEDAPGFHEEHKALTRLAPPSVSVVILREVEDSQYMESDRPGLVGVGSTPSIETTKDLLTRSVSISDRRVVSQLLQQVPPPAWRRSALLRNHRAIVLNEQGVTSIGDWELALDDEVGLTVNRAE